jgi:hypothetical protein
MAIADMQSFRLGNYSFAFCRARAYDNIVSREVQTFKSVWSQEWDHLIYLRRKPEPLKKGNEDFPVIKNRIVELVKNRREYICFWI